ncbi:MAG: TonB-dependent receptor [bacterium]|nr:TonB-dependent receptor [bacterium]
MTLAVASVTFGQDTQAFHELSLEELLDVQVFSSAKQSVPMSEVPAAVYVITADDIRRFGFPNVPEALRTVPGVNVARIDALSYAVTIRGYNGRFSNKLLVMIDGRSIYSALFSGVLWDVGVPMAEIDRIEVIRGPGSTLWGANAVNGIINIITKTVRDTDGGLVDVQMGRLLEASVMARYGEYKDDGPSFRVYGQFQQLASTEGLDGADLNGGGDIGVGGARLEWYGEESVSRFEVIGNHNRGGYLDLYPDSFEPPYVKEATETSEIESVAMMYAVEKNKSDHSGFKLSIHAEANRMDQPIFGVNIRRFGLDWSRHLKTGRHAVVWGCGYKLDEIDYLPTFAVATTTESSQNWRLDTFFQDALTVLPKRLTLTLGAKIEYGSLGDFGFQPNLRAMWTPHDQHTVWASVARSLRSPCVLNVDVEITNRVIPPGALGPQSPTARLRLVGNPDFVSEKLWANELGYRHMPVPWFAVDVAAYYNRYDDLSSMKKPIMTPMYLATPPHLAIDTSFSNGAESETWGGEVALDLRPSSWWRLRSTYSLLRAKEELVNTDADERLQMRAMTSPEHQISVLASFDIGAAVGMDAAWRYVDKLERIDASAYSELDFHLRWRVLADLTVSAAGLNLLGEGHNEYHSDEIIARRRSVIPRHFRTGLRWEF